jgi:hypothetical protein
VCKNLNLYFKCLFSNLNIFWWSVAYWSVVFAPAARAGNRNIWGRAFGKIGWKNKGRIFSSMNYKK